MFPQVSKVLVIVKKIVRVRMSQLRMLGTKEKTRTIGEGEDVDRWLHGMRRLRKQSLEESAG